MGVVNEVNYSMTVLSAGDEKFWRVPAGYSRAGSYLRCHQCASLVRNTKDDTQLHNEFHASLQGIRRWLHRLLGNAG
jgi:hypothetical protein